MDAPNNNAYDLAGALSLVDTISRWGTGLSRAQVMDIFFRLGPLFRRLGQAQNRQVMQEIMRRFPS